jgi:hypothetical protein
LQTGTEVEDELLTPLLRAVLVVVRVRPCAKAVRAGALAAANIKAVKIADIKALIHFLRRCATELKNFSRSFFSFRNSNARPATCQSRGGTV